MTGTAVTADAEVRGALRAMGVVLGVPVAVDEGDGWALDEHGLRVGLAWYRQRGHGDAEALALAALQLWEGPRLAVRQPARFRRARSLTRLRPDAAPLIAAIGRLQALTGLRRTMPGLRVPLAAAVLRELPDDPSVLPRHLQWVTAAISHGAGDELHTRALHADVREEWADLLVLGGDSIDPVRRVLSPSTRTSPVRSLERAVALLLPAYDRLLGLDLAERGLAVAGAGAEDPDEGRGLSGEAPDSGERTEAASDTGDEDTAAEPGSGDDREDVAGLFASDREAFISKVLSTPMPDPSTLIDLLAAHPELGSGTGAESDRVGAAASVGARAAAESTRLEAYRLRAAELAESVERMRALWERVLTERIEMRSARGRTPLAEGDELAMDYLAAAVADVLAGVERPPAFLRREPRQRRRWSAGSTDYVLLIDRSASMSGPAAEAAADAMLILAESIAGVERDIDHAERRTGLDLDLDVRTALIVFDSEAEVVKPLSRGMDDVVRRRTHASVRAPAGSTNDAAALQAAAEQFGVAGRGPRDAGRHGGTGDGRRRVAILVSDGGSNDTAAAERELAGLRAAGVQVHGVGLRTDDLTVRYAPTGARVDDIRRLPDALEAIVEQELP